MIAPFLIAFAGFGSLACSMPRHQRQVGLNLRHLLQAQGARLAGFTLLMASFVIALKDPSPIMLVEWIGALSAAAGCTVSTLTMRAKLLPTLAITSLVAGALIVLAMN